MIAWWESTIPDAVYSLDDTALYDWDDYVDQCEDEKTENDRMLPYLSTDAAPVIVGHKGTWVNEYVLGIESDMESMNGLRTYNFSYAKAQKLMKK